MYRKEYVVEHFNKPSKERYKSTYKTDWSPTVDSFDDFDLAFSKAKSLVKEGMFGVRVQVDEVFPDGETNTNIEELPCPYEALGVDQVLQELKLEKENLEGALFWAKSDSPQKVEHYTNELAKVEEEIKSL